MRRYTVVVVDDHPLVLLGVTSVLQGYHFVETLSTATNSNELFAILEQARIDIVVTDFSMPGGTYGDGLKMLRRLRHHYPNIKVLVLTTLDHPGLLVAIARIPVDGILQKSGGLKELPDAIVRVMRGHRYFGDRVRRFFDNTCMDITPECGPVLTPKELEVLRMLFCGRSVTQIAQLTHRSAKTISNQKQSAMRKLGCTCDAELYQLEEIGRLVQSVSPF
jgi:two-component system capsular synthesis response regulator RcsB